ncbi:protein BCCIP [Tripterygium wilfordii]|uniref:Protein BCCIP n=1 Tax=Tripterygium wilfordii TaxID=458696 RepID=A0A7J7BVC1_TRIWF|nr:protein BCCIP [Tripterygium wilfordii]
MHINKMTRRPRKHCQLMGTQPFTFSRFSRSVAHIASICSVKDQIHVSKRFHTSSPDPKGNRLAEHGMKEKNEVSESSKELDFEPTEELRDSFCFKSYLIASKIYKHKNADQKKWQNSHSDEAIIYTKPEDEIFHKLCSWSFMFPLRTQQVAAPEASEFSVCLDIFY